jgi:hypothetical protein
MGERSGPGEGAVKSGSDVLRRMRVHVVRVKSKREQARPDDDDPSAKTLSNEMSFESSPICLAYNVDQRPSCARFI